MANWEEIKSENPLNTEFAVDPINDFVEEEPFIEKDFYGDNLALYFSDVNLRKLASDLLQVIEEDVASRSEWLAAVNKAKQFLGYSLEDTKNLPFPQANRTYDLTLSTALMRYYATARSELLPSTGVAGFKINGIATDELMKKGELERDWLNYYLIVLDKAFYQDYERFILYLGLYGSVCRKIYIDPITSRPISRFIIPEDFIINNDCTSILESDRITHVLHLSKREILINQQNNVYRDIDLSHLGNGADTGEEENNNNPIANQDNIDLTTYTKRTLFPIYECHVYLNLEEYSNNKDDQSDKTIPLPYIVTIDKIAKEILSIRRNWQENDPEQKKINYFVNYNFSPGFGIYGNGLSHLIGSNAITLTRILNQLLDAATFKNLPAGLRVKGFKQQKNDITIGPGQFAEVDTGGIPLKEAFMPLPYSEPSLTLKELLMIQRDQTRELGATSEMGMLNSKEDIPTGTTLAMLEEQNRIPSAVLKSIHMAFSTELQLLSTLFRQTLDNEVFYIDGQERQITSNDFDEAVEIIPVSDPSMNSTVQRMYRAESIFRLATQAPEMHDMYEVYKMVYKAQGLSEEQIEQILKSEPQPEDIMPLDPITENINMLSGTAAKSAIWQDHASHKLIHGLFAEAHSTNQELQAAIAAHIKEHEAQEYLIEVEQLLGIALPPIEELQNPEVQNSIAIALANTLDQHMTKFENAQQQAAIDTNTLLMEDIKQKQEEIATKKDIAELKAETDVFKAQLDFEKEKAKIASNQEIAELKAETEMTKAEMNQM